MPIANCAGIHNVLPSRLWLAENVELPGCGAAHLDDMVIAFLGRKGETDYLIESRRFLH
jgi:hypothetical protein